MSETEAAEIARILWETWVREADGDDVRALLIEAASAITILSERLAAAENDAAAWKSDAGETHLKLVAAAGERDEARAWSAARAIDIATLGAALGSAEARAERLAKALEVIANSPAWGAPERWETTPAEVRQLARAALSTGVDE